MLVWPADQGRRWAVWVILTIAVILFMIIASSAIEQGTVRARLEKFRTMRVYPDIHTYRNEIEFRYLAPEKNSLEECEAVCLENAECTDINYYPANLQEKRSAQCWLFSLVKGKKVDVGATCCTLAVRGDQKEQIRAIDKRLGEQSPAENQAARP